MYERMIFRSSGMSKGFCRINSQQVSTLCSLKARGKLTHLDLGRKKQACRPRPYRPLVGNAGLRMARTSIFSLHASSRAIVQDVPSQSSHLLLDRPYSLPWHSSSPEGGTTSARSAIFDRVGKAAKMKDTLETIRHPTSHLLPSLYQAPCTLLREQRSSVKATRTRTNEGKAAYLRQLEIRHLLSP